MSLKQFGGKVTKQLEERYAKSSNWKEGKFQNFIETKMDISIWDMQKLMYKQIFEANGREPESPIPIVPLDKDAFLAPSNEMKFVWLGHSAVLMRINNTTILIDPMLGPNAAPIAPFSVKRFSKDTLDLIDDFPEIDLLLMTHDHYDHLDMDSIMKLIPKVNQYYVALGCARHLVKWGIDENLISEFDWWDEADFGNLKLTFTPSRHFSGRGLKDRAKSLWGGWTIKPDSENIYWSGDGGYGDHFKEVGERLGSFDFGFMECGQYNELWHAIHMFPEESVWAAQDATVANAMAVHWGGFPLAQHHWKDPIQRFIKESGVKELDIISPRIGEVVNYSDYQSMDWWSELK